jgi:hypothetical protein
MSKPKPFLEHILEALQNIEAYTTGFKKEDFSGNSFFCILLGSDQANQLKTYNKAIKSIMVLGLRVAFWGLETII